MAGDKDKSTPGEFITFLKGVGIRAFDRMAERYEEAEDAVEEAGSATMKKLSSYWRKLEPADKEKFFEQLITGAQVAAAVAGPVVAAGIGKLKEKKKAKKAKKLAKKAAGATDGTGSSDGTAKKKSKKKK